MTEAELVLFDDTAPAWERAFYAFLAEKERRIGSMRNCRRLLADATALLRDGRADAAGVGTLGNFQTGVHITGNGIPSAGQRPQSAI